MEYITPPGVRIADANRVRLRADLPPGITVMHGGFVNFNLGTLRGDYVIEAGLYVTEGTKVVLVNSDPTASGEHVLVNAATLSGHHGLLFCLHSLTGAVEVLELHGASCSAPASYAACAHGAACARASL